MVFEISGSFQLFYVKKKQGYKQTILVHKFKILDNISLFINETSCYFYSIQLKFPIGNFLRIRYKLLDEILSDSEMYLQSPPSGIPGLISAEYNFRNSYYH